MLLSDLFTSSSMWDTWECVIPPNSVRRNDLPTERIEVDDLTTTDQVEGALKILSYYLTSEEVQRPYQQQQVVYDRNEQAIDLGSSEIGVKVYYTEGTKLIRGSYTVQVFASKDDLVHWFSKENSSYFNNVIESLGYGIRDIGYYAANAYTGASSNHLTLWNLVNTVIQITQSDVGYSSLSVLNSRHLVINKSEVTLVSPQINSDVNVRVKNHTYQRNWDNLSLKDYEIVLEPSKNIYYYSDIFNPEWFDLEMTATLITSYGEVISSKKFAHPIRQFLYMDTVEWLKEILKPNVNAT